MEKIDLKATRIAPEVESLLVELVELTQRTSTICTLLQVGEENVDRIGCLISRIGKQHGIIASGRRPRGKARGFDSPSFLQRVADRIEASVLLSLHRRGPGGAANRTPHLLDMAFGPVERVLVLTRTYNKYRSLAVGEGEPRLSFEDYMALLDGIAANQIIEAQCGCCGARHVHNLHLPHRPECPFCKQDAETLKAAQDTIRQRQEKHRQQVQQARSTTSGAERQLRVG